MHGVNNNVKSVNAQQAKIINLYENIHGYSGPMMPFGTMRQFL